MARTLNSFSVKATLQAAANLSIDNGTFSTTCNQGKAATPTTALANGTGANQADTIWGDGGRALSSGGSESLDMYDLGSLDIGAGAGKDCLGQAVANAECVALLVVHESGTGDLLVGGEGSGAAWNSPFGASDTAKITLKPGGWVLFFAPADPAYVITDSTNHLLKFEASGGAVTYGVYALTRSA